MYSGVRTVGSNEDPPKLTLFARIFSDISKTELTIKQNFLPGSLRVDTTLLRAENEDITLVPSIPAMPCSYKVYHTQ